MKGHHHIETNDSNNTTNQSKIPLQHKSHEISVLSSPIAKSFWESNSHILGVLNLEMSRGLKGISWGKKYGEIGD